MEQFNIPVRTDLPVEDQVVFDSLSETFGKMPNIYAAFAKTENGLENYVNFQNRKSSLTNRQKEVVNLVVSQVNHCAYCLSQHTAIAKTNGFTEHQVLEIRTTDINFDPNLRALAKLAHNIALTKGLVEDEILENFYEAGFNEASLVDVVLAVGDKTIMNMMYASTKVPIDWPIAPSIEPTEKA